MTNKERKYDQRLDIATINGSSRGNIVLNGQWNKCNVYCPKCHAFNRAPHTKGCKGRKIRINSSARIPKKDSPKKVWDRFYEKFVMCRHYEKFARPEWKS